MRLTLADVFNQLVAERLAPPEAAERARSALRGADDRSPPWFARAVAGLGAWIATGCLIGFLAAMQIVDERSATTVGVALVAGAVYLRRGAEPDQDFRRQLALAVSLAGQVLFIVGVARDTRSGVVAGMAALLASLVLIPLVADPVHRVMSAVIGSIGTIAAAAALKLTWTVGAVPMWGEVVVRGSDLAALALLAVTAYVWRFRLRERSRALADMLEPVGYGTIAALFGVLLFGALFAFADDVLRGSRSARAGAWHLGALTTLGLAASLVALELSAFAEQRVKARREAAIVAVLSTLAVALLTLSTPGVMAALAVLALGFDRRNPILLGLSVVFLVKFVSAYYYNLQMTLLEKSVVLVASGVVLLMGWAYSQRRFGQGEAEA